ncbi:hypothetical protein [Amycolatopsis sp. CA-230715]|uniref:hypothetical protein n=1 Tax=Amycolatopsis sp. CA-230715 TaxID=2745196 RepID=UPI001C01C501|nr:hypothetical protein [Amycolatopsis sp. CA-230715]QWF81514.1 hypothetical protein HUW46_04946 [Amycolatopsis sp. CA-230715]
MDPRYRELPPAFAHRFRSSVVLIGVTLCVGTLLLYGLFRFIGGVLEKNVPAAIHVTDALAPLWTIALGVTLISARRCVRATYLDIAKARTTRNALLVCVSATMGFALLAVIVRALFHAGTPVALFNQLAFLALAWIGFAAGHFFVRPSLRTLQKFSGPTYLW